MLFNIDQMIFAAFQLRIPITGPLDGGYLHVFATREEETDAFKTSRIEWHADEGAFLIFAAAT